MSTLADHATLSPIKIELLLYVYCIAEPINEQCSRFNFQSLAVIDGLSVLCRNGLITPDPTGPLGKYKITARGTAHVSALCSLALPEPTWVSPSVGLTSPGSCRAAGELFRATKEGMAVGYPDSASDV